MNACEKRIEELLAEQPAAKEAASAERDHVADESCDSANPFARHTARLRAAMVRIVSEDDVQAVMRKMLTLAAAGSIPAMRLVMQYVIGKPTSAPNPDRVDADEWNIHKETAAMTEDMPNVVKSLEPEACLDMARNVRPIMSEVAMKKYAKEFDAPREKPPHPHPLSPEYRGEGGTPGKSVLPERTSEHESASPHGFDGCESNATPEYRETPEQCLSSNKQGMSNFEGKYVTGGI